MTAPSVGLVSLETWDSVWRRNQHLASRLVDRGTVRELTFVTPPETGFAGRARRWHPRSGITVVTPPLLIPRRLRGHRVLAAWLRRELQDVDVLWVNDPGAGRAAVRTGRPTLYDVTDDWRSLGQRPADLARIVAAEDVLAVAARTVVCSEVLRDRWQERYSVDAAVVPNGVDVEAVRSAIPVMLDPARTHAVYVGTVHANRVDLELVATLAGVVQVHLVGPLGLTPPQRAQLDAAGVIMHGPVSAPDVPQWLVAADVLICPHLVNDFTLSLDAIKSHEYLATNRPVVSTPSSGFQRLVAPGLTLARAADFVPAVMAAIGSGPHPRSVAVDWSTRAEQFARELLRAGA